MSFTFNDHSNLEGTHAYLSASSHSWLNYTDDHMREVYFNQLMKQRGTQLHAFAEMANRLGIKMPLAERVEVGFVVHKTDGTPLVEPVAVASETRPAVAAVDDR